MFLQTFVCEDKNFLGVFGFAIKSLACTVARVFVSADIMDKLFFTQHSIENGPRTDTSAIGC